MDLGFQGKTDIVTGSAAGIGFAIASIFVKQGTERSSHRFRLCGQHPRRHYQWPRRPCGRRRPSQYFLIVRAAVTRAGKRRASSAPSA